MRLDKIYTSDSYSGQKISKGLRTVIKDVLSFVSPKSIIDVGCGIGCWLSVFKEHGINSIGYDGPWVPKDKILIKDFREIDISKKKLPDVKADLLICIEVIEHLPVERTESFIREITSLAPVVLFSAAIPEQGGNNHINEQWQSHWVSLFKKQDYVMVDCLRQRWWNNTEIDAFAKQNMFFFVDASKLFKYPRLSTFNNNLPMDIVHPDMYKQVLKQMHTLNGIKCLLLDLPEIVKEKINIEKNI